MRFTRPGARTMSTGPSVDMSGKASASRAVRSATGRSDSDLRAGARGRARGHPAVPTRSAASAVTRRREPLVPLGIRRAGGRRLTDDQLGPEHANQRTAPAHRRAGFGRRARRVIPRVGSGVLPETAADGQGDRGRRHLGRRHAHRRQRRHGEGGHGDVVETHHRKLLGARIPLTSAPRRTPIARTSVEATIAVGRAPTRSAHARPPHRRPGCWRRVGCSPSEARRAGRPSTRRRPPVARGYPRGADRR